jgi:hypothetical protein
MCKYYKLFVSCALFIPLILNSLLRFWKSFSSFFFLFTLPAFELSNVKFTNPEEATNLL